VIGWKDEQSRGALKPGFVGDVTLLDPNRAWTYDVNKSFSKSKNSPFHEHTFQGGPVATIVGGQVVWRCDGF
jgi:dihydroorotase